MHCAHHCDQDLLTQLNILSRVMPHDAIATNNSNKPPLRIQKPSVYRSFQRFCRGENRTTNVVYIQQLLTQVVKRFESCAEDRNMRARIIAETRGAITGLHNLKQSYEDDAQFQASVDVSIETVKQRLGIPDSVPLLNSPMQNSPRGHRDACAEDDSECAAHSRGGYASD